MVIHPSDIKNKKILLAPLDWGMGHVTRCIPLIRIFVENGNELVFAGTSEQASLIRQDFEDIEIEEIPGYDIRLDSKKPTYTQLIGQFNKLKKAISKDTEIADDLALKHNVDIIVSDNRYGFYAKGKVNVFISHQLNLQIPSFGKLISNKLKGYISRFDVCWIPDDKDNPLCGELTSGDLDIDKIFIGLLSRFRKLNVDLKYKFIGIVSGPEPERSRFEKTLMNNLGGDDSVIVGMNESIDSERYVFNPSTDKLEELINQSEVVITRAGYTSIMELILLEKKALLIPTKGQFEQEYLSKLIANENLQFISEDELSIVLAQ